MNAPQSDGPVRQDEAGSTRAIRKRRIVFAGLAIALLAGLVGPSLQPPEPAAQAAVPISQTMRARIDAMSTGQDQPLVDLGDTAVERNARLPFARMSGGTMTGFAEISPTAPSYGAALKCLSQAIYYEAANEPEQGKRGVAQVVLNRLRHPAYPNSVCGVVYEGANARVCQFSFTCDGSLLRSPMARQWGESRRIAAQALAGSVAEEVGSATHYHADYVLPRWAFTLGKLTQIGRHIFYRFPGRIGNAPAFSDRWTGAERIPALDFNRMRFRLAAQSDDLELTGDSVVPGLTVAPDVKDRHAPIDVGGRLDTTTAWRLSVPDPVELSARYRNSLAGQGGAAAPGPAPTPNDAEHLQ